MATIDEYIKNHGFNVNAAKYMKIYSCMQRK